MAEHTSIEGENPCTEKLWDSFMLVTSIYSTSQEGVVWMARRERRDDVGKEDLVKVSKATG